MTDLKAKITINADNSGADKKLKATGEAVNSVGVETEKTNTKA